jgi:hypothetical protein
MHGESSWSDSWKQAPVLLESGRSDRGRSLPVQGIAEMAGAPTTRTAYNCEGFRFRPRNSGVLEGGRAWQFRSSNGGHRVKMEGGQAYAPEMGDQ